LLYWYKRNHKSTNTDAKGAVRTLGAPGVHCLN
jgi:hypothetical protein